MRCGVVQGEPDVDIGETIDKVEYASLLYDFYGALLGDSQREIMDLYHEDDMSLGEIAEELGQTRQGVHYTLKKAEAKLKEYEAKLGLVTKHLELRGEIDESEAVARRLLSDDFIDDSAKRDIAKMASLIRKLSE